MKWKESLKLTRTERFKKSVLELDGHTREKQRKQLEILISNPRHPSLGIKKIKETKAVFEAQVNDRTRFTFQYGEKGEIVLRVGRSFSPFPIDLFPMPDRLDPDVVFSVQKIDDPVRTDAQRKFSLQIAKEPLPCKWIGKNLLECRLNFGLDIFGKTKEVLLEGLGEEKGHG